jgi:hypothetical protein
MTQLENKIQEISKRYPLIIIFLVISLAMFQVVFFTKALKFDNASQIFIFSNYISQCVQSDIFPYWNPYLHLGSPFYSDLVSRFHYPLIWLFSYTTGYNFFTLHIEFFLVVIGTAIGSYKLLLLFKVDYLISVSFSIVMALSGFMLGHSQHLWIITSFCFFIWNLYFLFQILQFNKSIYFIPLGIGLAFSLLGGYSAMCFIQFYIYIFIGSYLLYKYRSLKSIAFIVLSVLIFAILCSGFFYSLYLTYPQITRTDGVPLAMANSHPFSPLSFLTFLFPGVIISDSGLFQTDLSMRAAYLGVFLLPLLYYIFRYSDSRKLLVLALVSILFFGFSLGFYTPLRSLLYDYVPFMNYFTYSSIFRFFPLMLLTLICALSLQHISQNNHWYILKKLLVRFLPFYILSFIVVLILLGLKTPSLHRFIEFNLIQFIFPFLALIIAYFGLIKLKSNDHRKYLICICILLDMVGTTQVLSPLLVYYRKKSVFDFHRHYHNYNRDFNFIPNKEIINYSHYTNPHMDSFLVNGNLLIKTPTIEGYNNYKLRKFYEVARIPNITKHKFIYTADSNSKVLLTRFSPNQMKARVFAKNKDTCILLQNYFQGWTAKVNGSNVPLIKDPYFPKLLLSAGQNEVEFNYEMPRIKFLHKLQMWSLAILVSLFIFLRFRVFRNQYSL